MTLARIVHMGKVFRKKYGVKGIVAARYLEAGFSVSVNVATREGLADFVAERMGEKILVDVIVSRKPSVDDVKRVKAKAASIKAKPVLALYGYHGQVPREVLEAAKAEGVKIKRVRG